MQFLSLQNPFVHIYRYTCFRLVSRQPWYCEGVSKSFRTESIKKLTATTNTR